MEYLPMKRSYASAVTAKFTVRTLPSVSPEWPDLDRPGPSHRVSGRDLDRLLEAAALDDVEPADRLFAFDERTICDDGLSVADADRAGSAGRSQLIAGDPAAARLEVVEPRKAFLIRGGTWIGLGLSIHLLGVPADEHQELHFALLPSCLPSFLWTTNAPDQNRQSRAR